MMQYVSKILRFESPSRVEWALYFSFLAVLHVPGILNFYDNDGSNNAFLLFSKSLIDGKLTLPAMESYQDMIAYKGNHYLPYPPFPSFVLLPFVALFGTENVNTVLIALILTCLNVFLFYKILIRLNIKQVYFPWLIIGLFFGTGYWFALFTSHHVYSFAQIISFSLQLLLIYEVLARRRWWLVGIILGCSFLTRQFTLFYVFLVLGYMFWLHYHKEEKVKLKQLVFFALTLGLFIGFYLAYNYARFGNMMDPGYQYILYNGVLSDRVIQHGVFSKDYFLFNFYSFFIKGFNIDFEGSGMMRIKDMDLWGTSLLAASPIVIASIRARWPRPLLVGAWITILVILAGILFYHNNGYHQVNTMRFSLDFLPLLFVLTAMGIQDVPSWLYRLMIGYAVFLNLLSFLIHYIYQ